MWNATIPHRHLMNICYPSHYARKRKGQSDVYRQEAEHFVLNLAVTNSEDVAVPWLPICPQKLNVRPQRLTFTQRILQSGHLHQNTDAKPRGTIKKQHSNTIPSASICAHFHHLHRKKLSHVPPANLV